ncbi:MULTISPECIES: D-2-hydroxyacid dehydrogenase [Halolamina]|uniref:D-2-hydroxyacid dehydrogenase (NADP+) n=1 Tax=Halolamina pelagica TaxID=699431 RepID=A0A1I5N180_9EURY|nr:MULTISPECIES: D-2-hydroxyacid dehydrogenase [Halolamina]NHX36257.1 D-2-hydroxyacid dehydrogenase [Halolamina sp. R1-12]SFP15519.1 D-2-hydroxyacid dehydrogenase (NADP+) [Halolamina pelagica]
MVTRIGIHASIEALFPPEVLRDRLAAVDPEVVVVDTDEVDAVDALVTFAYEDAFLDAGLDWIHSVQAGIDRFPLEEFEAAGINLTNSTGTHGDSVGETVAGYMLAFARRLHEFRSKQERKEWAWAEWDAPFTLSGSSLCVVGLGTLGRGIAARADALGMDVTGVKRTPTPVDHVDTVHPSSELHEAIGGAKFVALAVPLTDETEGLIGAEELARMRADAVLVNVARGGVVDQSALADALRADDLGGAALDVFETEPLPADSPLWDMDDVIVTPHSAAAHREYPDRMAALVRENLRRIDDGERLANGVV